MSMPRTLRTRLLVSLPVMLALVPPGFAQRTIAEASESSAARRAIEGLLDRKISINVSDVPLKRAIDAATLSARVPVQYREQIIDAYGRMITLQLRNVPLRAVLDRLLSGTSLRVVPDGTSQLMIVEGTKSSVQQTVGAVRGRVVDSADVGVARANVTVRGTDRSAVTNANGDFTLADVPVGEQMITIKALGFAATTHPVRVGAGTTAAVRVVLTRTAHMLSGVVTTATGEQRKLEVGNSITTINVDSLMQVAPIRSVTDILESRVPGMSVQRTSGSPGDPARIRLRGASSITQNNDPIIIVDGIRMYGEQSEKRNINTAAGFDAAGHATDRQYATPSPLDQIDPNSIEKVEVFKGPSASAMYGSDAANGVIVITTKRGRAGRPEWSFVADAGRSSLPGKWPTALWTWVTPVLGGAPVLCIGPCGDAVVDSAIRFSALNDPWLTALGTGSEYGGATTLSGGTAAMTYNVTMSTSTENGILKLPDVEAERYQRFQGVPAPKWMRRPDAMDRRGVTANMVVTATKNVNFSFTSSLEQSLQRRTSMSSSNAAAIATLEKTWVDVSQLRETPILGNPYERVRSDAVTMRNILQMNATPFVWLPLSAQAGVMSITRNDHATLAPGLLPGPSLEGTWSGATASTSDFTANGFTRIPLHRRLTLGMGVNMLREATNDQRGQLVGFAPGVTDPSEGTDVGRTRFRRNTTDRQTFGWFVEPQLHLSSRFFAMPGFRLDNNGLSGKNAKFNGLPKMNLSWIASDESFFPFKNSVQLLRFRTAYGVAGVQPKPGDVSRLYEQITRVPVTGTDTTYGELIRLSYLGNTRLRPERGVEWEGGVDVDLFSGRIRMDLTYYRKQRHNAIISVPYASSVNTPFLEASDLLNPPRRVSMNLGDINNAGVEARLDLQLVQNRQVRLGLAGTFSTNRSKIVRLTEDGAAIGRDDESGIRYVVGYPMEGLWQRPIVGYNDVNGDGWLGRSELVIGSDPVYIGTTEPRYLASVAPNLSLWQGRLGVYATLGYTSGQLVARDANRDDGAATPLQVLVAGPSGLEDQAAYVASKAFNTSIGYGQKVNVLRLQSLALSFTMPAQVAQRLRARTASLALQGDNVALRTNYIGVDPNVNSSLGASGLLDAGQLPLPRTWSVRLNLRY